MSWLFSQALVEASSPDIALDGAPCALWSGTHTPRPSWLPAKTTAASRLSRSGMTCKRLTDDDGEAVLTSFLAASPAKTFPLQAQAPESTAPDPACGRTWPASFARWDRPSSTWKTPQLSLVAGWDEYSATWPRWGMMRGGECSELPTWERHTSGTGSGFWRAEQAAPGIDPGVAEQYVHRSVPTPNVFDSHDAQSMQDPLHWLARQRDHADRGVNLQWPLRVAAQMFPTPLTSDHHGPNWSKPGRQKYPASANTLRTVVHGWKNGEPWPTPTARDWRSGCASEETHARNARPLSEHVGGLLNPDWVEWLMGWPIGWTRLDAAPGPMPDGAWWDTEPDIPRTVPSQPHRVDRLRCLGNGQVPACAAEAFRRLAKNAQPPAE
jgi:hypothetical protein